MRWSPVAQPIQSTLLPPFPRRPTNALLARNLLFRSLYLMIITPPILPRTRPTTYAEWTGQRRVILLDAARVTIKNLLFGPRQERDEAPATVRTGYVGSVLNKWKLNSHAKTLKYWCQIKQFKYSLIYYSKIKKISYSGKINSFHSFCKWKLIIQMMNLSILNLC